MERLDDGFRLIEVKASSSQKDEHIPDAAVQKHVAYDLGLIDTDLPFEQARERFRINDRAERFADSPDFSVKIRSSE